VGRNISRSRALAFTQTAQVASGCGLPHREQATIRAIVQISIPSAMAI
jgi:hypothetical protein